MNLSIRTRTGFRPAIPYTNEALERDLYRVQEAWDDTQADRRRGAIYGYLEAVYDLVSWWSADGSEVDRARQALRSRGFLPWPREDAHAAMIRCTADPARADKRTRSKWSRALRYAKMEKDEQEVLAASSRGKAASTNASCDTASASGDLLRAGDQSGLLGAARQASS